jgi:large subunit ribosomal protein L16
MLFPKKVKHRKWQRMRRNKDKISPATRGVTVSYGAYGIRSTTYARVTSQQIEAARRVVKRMAGKTGRVWIRVFPDRPYTAKAAEVGMGKGKGEPQGYEIEVYPGHILFEMDGVDEATAREAARKASTKLPVKVKLATRE